MLQSWIKMDYFTVYIISFTEHAYNFEHFIFFLLWNKQQTEQDKKKKNLSMHNCSIL